MDSARHGAGFRRPPLLADLLESVLCNGEHDPEHHAAGGRARIEVVVDRDEHAAHVADPADLHEAVDQIAAEPVGLPDDQTIGFAALDPGDCLLE
jgi:hypothetical protein